MANEPTEPGTLGATRRALALITEAMDLLDAHGAQPEEAAHLAMVQQRLRQALARASS